MAKVSSLPWLAVCGLMLLQVGIAAVSARFNRSGDTLARQALSRRVLVLVGVAAYLGVTRPVSSFPADTVLLLGFCCASPIAYWSAGRLRDLGQPAARATVTGLPLVGVLYLIYLMARTGNPHPAPPP